MFAGEKNLIVKRMAELLKESGQPFIPPVKNEEGLYDWTIKLQEFVEKEDLDFFLIFSVFSYGFISKQYDKISSPEALISNFKELAIAAIENAGMHFLAKVLAFTGVIGGEICVFHPSFRYYTPLAQAGFGMRGGYSPRHVDLIQRYMNELAEGETKTLWLPDFYKKMGIPKKLQVPAGHFMTFWNRDKWSQNSPTLSMDAVAADPSTKEPSAARSVLETP